MVVICKVQGCPYKSTNGFCRNRVLALNEDGSCSHIYKGAFGHINERWREPVSAEFFDGYILKQKEKKQGLLETKQQLPQGGSNDSE